MDIPRNCTVLVIGGGPAGSYASCVLAREGVDVVCLEADVFPRYHIGESMLPSIRHFLKFIELDHKFDAHGFRPKKGGMFKLNAKQPVYTDFVAAGGPNGYAWNVVRSEADDMLFRHAGDCGAHIFDGVRVKDIQFELADQPLPSIDTNVPDLGRPVSATWSRKADGATGTIDFQYIIDASGRAGLLSTKYMGNRVYNKGLQNVASWGYWTGMHTYGPGTIAEGQPYFEALDDASGWAWTIPLHNGVTSVGIVQNRDVQLEQKKAMGSPGSREFYLATLKRVPGIEKLLSDATLSSDPIKSASDWSYSASSYAVPYARVAGDAGCFIDPLFSSGYHLAMSAGLSAALTINAVLRDECDERTAAKWHSEKVAEGYTRFLIVVLSAVRQIRQQNEPILNDIDEATFDRAFAFFQPIIQGTVDTSTEMSQAEIEKTVEFCMQAFKPGAPTDGSAVQEKLDRLKASEPELSATKGGIRALEARLSAEEQETLNTVRARKALRCGEDMVNLNKFSTDVIAGMAPRLVRGELGLRHAEPVKFEM